MMTLQALGETLPVYEGEFEALGRIRLKMEPAGSRHALHRRACAGNSSHAKRRRANTN